MESLSFLKMNPIKDRSMPYVKVRCTAGGSMRQAENHRWCKPDQTEHDCKAADQVTFTCRLLQYLPDG
jgi:hypothetical protein